MCCGREGTTGPWNRRRSKSEWVALAASESAIIKPALASEGQVGAVEKRRRRNSYLGQEAACLSLRTFDFGEGEGGRPRTRDSDLRLIRDRTGRSYAHNRQTHGSARACACRYWYVVSVQLLALAVIDECFGFARHTKRRETRHCETGTATWGREAPGSNLAPEYSGSVPCHREGMDGCCCLADDADDDEWSDTAARLKAREGNVSTCGQPGDS